MSLVYTPFASDNYSANSGKRNQVGLYLGGQKDAKNRDKLQKWGVTHILNVTPEKESGIESGIPNYFPSNFAYKRIPVYDLATTNLLQYATQITSFIAKGLHHGSVFVHCKKGKSRSSTCVLFYLMEKRRFDLKHALQLLKRKRENVDPIPAFLDQAKEFESRLKADGIDLNETGVNVKQKSNVENKKITEKKKIKMGPSIGPIKGPSIGPIRGPTVGPMYPSRDPNEEKNAKRRKISDSKPCPKKVPFGPELPPSKKKQDENSYINIGPSPPTD